MTGASGIRAASAASGAAEEAKCGADAGFTSESMGRQCGLQLGQEPSFQPGRVTTYDTAFSQACSRLAKHSGADSIERLVTRIIFSQRR